MLIGLVRLQMALLSLLNTLSFLEISNLFKMRKPKHTTDGLSLMLLFKTVVPLISQNHLFSPLKVLVMLKEPRLVSGLIGN